jgi:ubiquinone/menaquinone biosynthesis C-methylase UbiE
MTTDSSVLYSGSIPKMYDKILGPVYFEPYAIETANRVAKFGAKSILEIACGTGRVTNHLRKILPEEIKITATDISVDMLAVAKEKLSSTKNIFWKEADAMNLPFDSHSFDVVVCQFGAMFFSDRKEGFSEVNRVLEKNGKFIFAVWDKMEFNPIALAGRKVLLDFFEGNPPEMLRTAFSMTDKNIIQKLLEECSFRNIKIESVSKPCEAESAELLALASVDGSIVYKFIKERNPDAVEELKNKIAESISEKFGNHPVKSSQQAIIITAEK